MNKIAILLVIMGIVSALAVGSYFGYKSYQKRQYMDACVERMFADTTDPAIRAEQEPVAIEFCNCVYTQVHNEGMPEGFAEIGCAFDILIRLGPDAYK